MECSRFDFGCHLSWLESELVQIVLGIYESILSALSGLVSLIPAPAFLTVNQAALPSSVLYFSDLLNLSYGLSVVVSAYSLRFLLRRIPFIG